MTRNQAQTDPATPAGRKILFYNWVDFSDRQRRGGGVTVYQRALIASLGAEPGTRLTFLSSGMAHDLRAGAPRWRRLAPAEGALRYEMVNARPVAPAHADFGSPAQLSHPPTEAAFFDFIARTGPYDVVHFNNLEGIPGAVLALKARWPQTRVILSLHNYYPFCPQVNLWRDERVHCADFDGGRACATCLPVVAKPGMVRLSYAIEGAMARLAMGPGSVAFDRVFYPGLRAGWQAVRRLAALRRRGKPAAALRTGGADTEGIASTTPDPQPFAARRAGMVALINQHCDAVLCVSDRVREIAAGFGLDPARLHTSYIGTREAARWHETQPRPTLLEADGTLHLAYLGYMRADKGFFFLLDALEALPAPMAARLRLTIAARRGPPEIMARIDALAPRLAALRYQDGYSHAGLNALLDGVGLGLVPVLWEDNLPQVAIEMHARHIPLLCADRGGAQELGRCTALTFRAGDAGDFERALHAVFDGEVDLAAYWQGAMPPVEMDGHLAQLRPFYGLQDPA